VLQLLAESKPTLAGRFGLVSLALFGSTRSIITVDIPTLLERLQALKSSPT
jgi:hypothetical protein